jgi:hypothetical protein
LATLKSSNLEAWCDSTELLEVYRAAVLQTQQQLRRMPAISLASLHFALQDFKVRLFPPSCMHADFALMFVLSLGETIYIQA